VCQLCFWVSKPLCHPYYWRKKWVALMNIGDSNRIADKQNHLSNTELIQLMLHLPCKSVDGKMKTPSPSRLCDIEQLADPVRQGVASSNKCWQPSSCQLQNVVRSIIRASPACPHTLQCHFLWTAKCHRA
jgi:hypothetical protein